MKRIFTITLTLMPILMMAQIGFEPQLKVSYEVGTDKYKNQSFGGEFVGGYRLSETLRIGIGGGIYWCKHLYEEAHFIPLTTTFIKEYRETASYIPIFINGKLNLGTSSKWNPYLAADLGFALFNSASKYADDNKLGFFLKPAFGVDYSQGKGALFFELGYKYQDRKFQNVQMGYSQLTISIGYQF